MLLKLAAWTPVVLIMVVLINVFVCIKHISVRQKGSIFQTWWEYMRMQFMQRTSPLNPTSQFERQKNLS